MLTVRDYISINKQHIRNCQKALRQIAKGKYQYDGTIPMECVKPMYEAKIVRLTEANEFLRVFAPEHVLTSDEAYKCRAIINGTTNL